MDMPFLNEVKGVDWILIIKTKIEVWDFNTKFVNCILGTINKNKVLISLYIIKDIFTPSNII